MAEIACMLLAGSRGCAGSGGRANRLPSTIQSELDGTDAERAAVSCEHRDAGFLTRVRAMLRSGAVERAVLAGYGALNEEGTSRISRTRWTKPGRRRYEYRSFPPPAQPFVDSRSITAGS